MIVEVDINVVCPKCGCVMVRHREIGSVICGTKGCSNCGVQFEIPRLILHQKYDTENIEIPAERLEVLE